MARKPQKIKVLFTIPDFDTAGSGKALLKIATRLNKDLFEPHIACMHTRGAFFKVVEQSGIPVHIFQYTTPMKPYYKGLLNCIKIAKQFRKIKPNIVHSFHFSADYSEPLAAKFAGVKWIYSKKNMSWGGSSKNSWKMRTFLANHIIYQNTDMKKMFFPNLNKTTLIPRGVDASEFFPNQRSKVLLQKYHLREEDRVLIAVANLVPLKGIDVLIKSFNQSKMSVNNWKLLIVGDKNNSHGEDLEQLVVDMNLEDKVIFTGKVLNVSEHLSLAEVFVLPTIFKGEGSPVALLEAMATGLCVLGSNLPGIRDQLRDCPEHLIEAGNIDKWSEKLEELSNKTSEELGRLGKVFLAKAKTNYLIEKEVENTEKLYLSV